MHMLAPALPWVPILLLGACVGSFIGVVVTRLPTALPIIVGRSRCDTCHTPLSARDLVPVLSFAALSGRCRSCGASIGTLPIATEVAGAFIAMSACLLAPTLAAAAALALFGWTLLTLALLDWRALWLPDRIVLPLLVAGLAASLVLPEPSLLSRILGAALGYVSLEALRLGYRRLRGREGLGGGDPKLFAAIGAWLGAAALPGVMLIASAIGLGIAGLTVLSGRRLAADRQLPLGTFLAIAGGIVLAIEHAAL